LLVIDLVDAAHPTLAQGLNDLEAAGEGGTRGELPNGSLKSFRDGWRMVLGGELGAAPGAESRSLGIVRMAGRALVGHASSPSLTWRQINRGIDGKSNVACLRGPDRRPLDPESDGVPFYVIDLPNDTGV
jgi:hypothetical protein